MRAALLIALHVFLFIAYLPAKFFLFSIFSEEIFKTPLKNYAGYIIMVTDAAGTVEAVFEKKLHPKGGGLFL